MNHNNMTYAETEEAARKLARLLGERHHGFTGQIRRVIRLRGVEFAHEMYDATVEIEANGGMMLPDNSRRRTRGGVFLQLVRAKLDDDEQKHISRGAKPRLALLSWKRRIEIIESLQTGQGQVKSITVLLSGRPEQVEKRAEFVVVTLLDVSTINNLPRGLPLPPPISSLVMVYVAPEEWQKVEAAIATSPDKLLIEGLCAVDSESKNMMVFATSVQMEVLKTKSTK